jgi:hypothetical protein
MAEVQLKLRSLEPVSGLMPDEESWQLELKGWIFVQRVCDKSFHMR